MKPKVAGQTDPTRKHIKGIKERIKAHYVYFLLKMDKIYSM